MSDSKQQGQMQVDAQNQQAAASNTDQQKAQIGVLEEDDEFEEFPVQDWKDEETDVAKYLEQTGARSGPSHLWEDTWDDDDVEEDFSVQLREELAKATKSGEGDAMQT